LQNHNAKLCRPNCASNASLKIDHGIAGAPGVNVPSGAVLARSAKSSIIALLLELDFTPSVTLLRRAFGPKNGG
jgi:hypothetical protein